MKILFIVIFVLSSQLIHSVAVDQENGYNPYKFGATTFCILQHPLLLITSIFYLGWLWGIILFLCHLFGVLNMTVSWVLDIPLLLLKISDKFESFLKIKVTLLPFMFIILLIFTIASFFLSSFESLLVVLQNETAILVGILIGIAILSIARLVLVKTVIEKL